MTLLAAATSSAIWFWSGDLFGQTPAVGYLKNRLPANIFGNHEQLALASPLRRYRLFWCNRSMLAPLLFLAAFATPLANPVSEAITRFQQVNTYEAVVTTESAGQVEQMRYHYQKPGYLRLDFIQPHPGLVLTYNPINQQVHVWPSGFNHFPSFHTSPDNSLLRSSGGHRVDQSDVGYFWHHVQRLQMQGTSRVVASAGTHTNPIHLVVEGAPGVAVNQYHKFDIWMEPQHYFPIRTTGYDLEGNTLDTVTLQDLQFGITYPPSFFD